MTQTETIRYRNVSYLGVPARVWSSYKDTKQVRIDVTVWDADTTPRNTTQAKAGTAIVRKCVGDGRYGTYRLIAEVVTDENGVAEAVRQLADA